MKKVIAAVSASVLAAVVILLAAAVSGCTSSKARHVDMAGMCATEAGLLAIGSIEIQSTPDGGEAALVRYEDSEPWIGDEKEHRISITLTGTNSVANAAKIVKSICEAFKAVAAERGE